jgi:hypothetical protein
MSVLDISNRNFNKGGGKILFPTFVIKSMLIGKFISQSGRNYDTQATLHVPPFFNFPMHVTDTLQSRYLRLPKAKPGILALLGQWK